MKGKKIIYTPEMEQFIMDNQYGISRQALADKLNKQFKTKLNAKHMSRYCTSHNLSNGNDGRFVKGQAAANKGVPISAKTYEKIKATMFKPGNVPKNHRPVGSERVNVDGYIEIKIAEPRKWTLKHRYVWEKANGPIPKGCVIIFVDQNKLNVSLDNLRLIKKSHLCEINRLGSSLTSNKELNSAIIDVAELSVAINKAKKERKSNETKK